MLSGIGWEGGIWNDSDADLLLAGLDVVAARLWKEIFGWEAEVWLCC